VSSSFLPFVFGFVAVIAVFWLISTLKGRKRPRPVERAAQSKKPRSGRRVNTGDVGDSAVVPSGGSPYKTQFQAFGIQIGADACPAARHIVEKRFLSTEMPELPLEGCDKECRCKFVVKGDRRRNEERRAPAFPATELGEGATEGDRRGYHDRRRNS